MIHLARCLKGGLPLLFLLFSFSPSLVEAFSFKDIIFSPASSEFQVEDSIETSDSNFVKVSVKVEDQNETEVIEERLPTLSFYRYDSSSDEYLKVEETEYVPSKELIGKFNPMTSLLLDNGKKIDISKKLPTIKCLVFKRNEPLIIVYHDSHIETKKCLDFNVQTESDEEIVRLKNSDGNRSLFVGYINTSTTCLRKHDGKIFVKKGDQIRASLWHQEENVREKSTKSLRTLSSPSVFAMAFVEVEPLAELGERVQQESKADIWIDIKASKEEVSSGEFVKFDCEIENRGDKESGMVNLSLALPASLRYRSKTLYIDDKKREEGLLTSVDRSLILPLKIDGHSTKHVSFVAQVGISKVSVIESKAFVRYANKISPIATSQIFYRSDFDESAVVMGRLKLLEDSNVSLAGVRFYLEDGHYTHSDQYGKFHFDGLTLGRHVVSIDPQSIEGKFVLQECSQDARRMGSQTSSLVDLTTSHIQRVSFCLKEDKQIKALNATLDFTLPSKAEYKMPDFTQNSFAKLDKKTDFLWPLEDSVPPMPAVKVAFMHPSSQKVELYLNGKKVDLLNYDGFIKSRDKKWTISKYRGIDIIDGDNIFEMHVGGQKIRRKVHLSTAPVRAKLLPEKSFLVADGKNNPIIAVQLFDMAGYPLREGMVGEFAVQKPYLSQERVDNLSKNPLSNNYSSDKYTVLRDGIAFIPLQATTLSGEVKLHFPFQQKNEYVKTWLSSRAREWFIVGFAEGSIGYQKIKTEMIKDAKSEIIHDEKISLFAKGKIPGDALLSIAYDSGKRTDLGIMEELDPQSSYTVYGDESAQKSEAPSSKKLFIKIEKSRFYALFGDFDTGMDTHELSRYTRRLNGVKSEFNGEMFSYRAFVSQSKHSFQREELPGDGTSGIYRLKSKDIVLGSERIMIEVRDRYRDEVVISRKNLSALMDYTIDYLSGTIYFKEPIMHRDGQGNPQIIVVSYEQNDGDNKRLSYGGRAAIKGFDGRLELGAGLLAEEHDEVDSLYSIDARLNLDESTRINGEFATSKSYHDSNLSAAKAYLLELSHHNRYSESKLYYRYEESGFGIGQTSRALQGMQKYGVDSTFNYWQNIAIKVALYGEKSLSNQKTREAAEIISQYEKRGFSALAGVRFSNEGDDGAHTQLVTALSKRLFNNKIRLSGAYEYTLDGASDRFSNRTFAELSYFVNQYIEIFANHEILEGKTNSVQRSRIGVKGRPWSGGTLESAVSEEWEENAPRLFGHLGVNQNWKVSKELALNLGYEQEKTFQSEDILEGEDDFSAYTLGVNYTHNKWIYSQRLEYRTSKEEDKINVDAALYTEVNNHMGMALGLRSNLLKNSFTGDSADHQAT